MTMPFSLRFRRLVLVSAALGLVIAASGCSDDDNDNGGNAPGQTRAYNQVQRLGNPLVSEVLLAKRSHPTHGATGPSDDASLIAAEALGFLTGPGSVAGRDPGYAAVLGGALIPDMLIVQTDKDPANSGWLTWLNLAPFTNGYGGRKLSDDVEDFPRDVAELLSYFAPARPGQLVRAVPGEGLRVPVWLLGSSLYSAQLAAHVPAAFVPLRLAHKPILHARMMREPNHPADRGLRDRSIDRAHCD